MTRRTWRLFTSRDAELLRAKVERPRGRIERARRTADRIRTAGRVSFGFPAFCTPLLPSVALLLRAHAPVSSGGEALPKVRTSRWRRDARISPCRSGPVSDQSSFLRESFRLVFTRVFLYAFIRDSIGVPRSAFPRGGRATLDHTIWTRTWFPK